MEFAEILKWAHDKCEEQYNRRNPQELALLLTLYNTARILGASLQCNDYMSEMAARQQAHEAWLRIRWAGEAQP